MNKDYICLYKHIKQKEDFLFSFKVHRTSDFLDAAVKPVSDKKKNPQMQVKLYQ